MPVIPEPAQASQDSPFSMLLPFLQSSPCRRPWVRRVPYGPDRDGRPHRRRAAHPPHAQAGRGRTRPGVSRPPHPPRPSPLQPPQRPRLYVGWQVPGVPGHLLMTSVGAGGHVPFSLCWNRVLRMAKVDAGLRRKRRLCRSRVRRTGSLGECSNGSVLSTSISGNERPD